MADTTQTVNIDSTISLLQGDLSMISPDAAIANIDAWQTQLQGTDIAETLGELKMALNGDAGGSAMLSEILKDLGAQTSTAASSASSDVTSKLQQLAQLLTQAGNSTSS